MLCSKVSSFYCTVTVDVFWSVILDHISECFVGYKPMYDVNACNLQGWCLQGRYCLCKHCIVVGIYIGLLGSRGSTLIVPVATKSRE